MPRQRAGPKAIPSDQATEVAGQLTAHGPPDPAPPMDDPVSKSSLQLA